jgi:hypothetical protein
MKLKFLIRLSKNELTLKILEFQVSMKYSDSFTEEIAVYFGLNHDYDLENLIEESEIKIKALKAVKKPTPDMYNENKVNSLRLIFNTKNRFIIPDKIFEIIKFGNKNESLKEILIRKRKNRNNKIKPRSIIVVDLGQLLTLFSFIYFYKL